MHPAHATAIAQSIDRLFANSDHETKTVSEKEFVLGFIRQLADINFIVSAIIGAVFFTLLFLTGNTMMQSVRERIPEFATMKAIGYSGGVMLAMVIAEGLVLALIAAILGLSLSALAFPAMKAFLGVAALPPVRHRAWPVLRRPACPDHRAFARHARGAAQYHPGTGKALTMLEQIIAVTVMNLKTLHTRVWSSLVIMVGVAGVVGVLVSVLAMATGLVASMEHAGRPDRIIVLRGGSDTETSSQLTRSAVATILSAPRPSSLAAISKPGFAGLIRRRKYRRSEARDQQHKAGGEHAHRGILLISKESISDQAPGRKGRIEGRRRGRVGRHPEAGFRSAPRDGTEISVCPCSGNPYKRARKPTTPTNSLGCISNLDQTRSR